MQQLLALIAHKQVLMRRFYCDPRPPALPDLARSYSSSCSCCVLLHKRLECLHKRTCYASRWSEVLFSKHKAHGSPVVGWHSSLVCTEGTPAACCPCKAIGRKISWQRHSHAFQFGTHRANLCTRATGVSTTMSIWPDRKRRRATLPCAARKTLQSSTPQIRKLWWFQRTWE
jgi:hypothetical protein